MQAPGERKRNCANPIVWATENKKTVDVFLIFTDGDTSESSIHPREALKKYRDELNIPDARLGISLSLKGQLLKLSHRQFCNEKKSQSFRKILDISSCGR